ncbi:MAG: T9SS type A sorting domain-containing protein [Chitinophagaceae bacterium]|nr:T9SS type A sorting domain-containing protein [Chitinophagaceae bacterium]
MVNSDTTKISFAVTDDAASAAGNRFMIVIEPTGIVPVTFTNIRAYEFNHDIMVEWAVQNELDMAGYEVEKSLDGILFNTVNHTPADGGHIGYNWLDEHAVAGDNFYRIKSKDNNGRIKYSSIVKVRISGGKPAISIYPNPVTDGMVHIGFNNMPAGAYYVKLYNTIGQLVFAKQLIHAGGNTAETMRFKKNLSKGIYQMELTHTDTGAQVYKLIIE